MVVAGRYWIATIIESKKGITKLTSLDEVTVWIDSLVRLICLKKATSSTAVTLSVFGKHSFLYLRGNHKRYIKETAIHEHSGNWRTERGLPRTLHINWSWQWGCVYRSVTCPTLLCCASTAWCKNLPYSSEKELCVHITKRNWMQSGLRIVSHQTQYLHHLSCPSPVQVD